MKALTLAMLIPVAALVACNKTPDANIAPAPAAAVAPGATTALAELAGASGSSVKGEFMLTASDGGVSISGQLSGLPPRSVHGFHVHETGDCTAPDAKSAGEHLNPAHVPHGGPSTEPRHLGDLPNVESDAEGRATVSATVANATLSDGGPNDLVGKALIVHAMKDDYTTQPSGNSGDRIACGVVR